MILAFVGIVGIGVAIWTVRIIKRQTEATEDAAKAAADSVEAIHRQAGIMEHQFAISHRPWVTVSGEMQTNGPLVFDDSGAHISISYFVKNGGIAPAIGTVTMMSALVVGPMPQTPEAARQVIGCEKSPANQISNTFGIPILPNDTYEVKRFLLETQQRQAIAAVEPQEVWFTICIRYKDELGNAHGTGLLWRFDSSDGKRAILPKGSVQGTFTRIGFGNESY
jgi:hypothetical protein